MGSIYFQAVFQCMDIKCKGRLGLGKRTERLTFSISISWLLISLYIGHPQKVYVWLWWKKDEQPNKHYRKKYNVFAKSNEWSATLVLVIWFSKSWNNETAFDKVFFQLFPTNCIPNNASNFYLILLVTNQDEIF